VYQRIGSTWTQQAYLKASNSEAGDQFGISLSLSGDTLAVGATGESSSASGIGGNQSDNSASQSGAVYVFQRTGSAWAQQAYIKASNPGVVDQFGISVSLSGDTLAVGAWAEDSNATGAGGNQLDNSATDSGAVYVFQRSGIAWTQQAYLKASNTNAQDNFGVSVSLSGDTLAVGADGESSSTMGIAGNQLDNSAQFSGAAYVFQRSGTSWAQQVYLKASNTDAQDRFGGRVSLSGDTLAVAATFEASAATGVNGNQNDNSAAQSGAVYVFQRAGTTWTQQAYLKASNTGAGQWFGYGLALLGDTLAVGSVWESSSATGIGGSQTNYNDTKSGAVYLFQRTGTTWAQRAYIKATNTDANDQFGVSVSLLSDNTLAVGANQESSNATDINGNQTDNSAAQSGAVYIFQ
jgi:hypothetical protein